MADTVDQSPQDAVLALRCQLGDQAAWKMLVERWNPKLRSFVSRMLTRQAGVEDVLQEVWLKIVRSMSRLEEPSKLPAWLYRIARTSVADHLRQQYRTPETDLVDDVAADDKALERLIASDEVHSALIRLHPNDREVVVLHYLEQLRLAEVAAICDIPVGTVKSRLHRARGILRPLLTQENTQS